MSDYLQIPIRPLMGEKPEFRRVIWPAIDRKTSQSVVPIRVRKKSRKQQYSTGLMQPLFLTTVPFLTVWVASSIFFDRTLGLLAFLLGVSFQYSKLAGVHGLVCGVRAGRVTFDWTYFGGQSKGSKWDFSCFTFEFDFHVENLLGFWSHRCIGGHRLFLVRRIQYNSE